MGNQIVTRAKKSKWSTKVEKGNEIGWQSADNVLCAIRQNIIEGELS